ncbi:MAG TPA: PP2C family serine/threonine-protein phosphatase [Bacillales bacterium]|nr:PP2C family serine/threonine-protein phosphatase [Bacillales bacterium]
MIKHHTYKQMKVGAVQKTKPGQSYCGDSYFVTETEDYFICALADGLGSGVEASRASGKAVSVIEAHHDESIDVLMRECNKALAFGRGAVLSIFKIFYHTNQLAFSGVGNVRFMLRMPNGEVIYPLSTGGFLSGRPQPYRVQTFPYEKGTSFIIYSDGFDMNTAARRPLLCMGSPEEASRYVRLLLEDGTGRNDDVTFIFGTSVEEDEVQP